MLVVDAPSEISAVARFPLASTTPAPPSGMVIFPDVASKAMLSSLSNVQAEIVKPLSFCIHKVPVPSESGVADVNVRVDPTELLIAISELAAVVVTVRLETAVSKALKPLPPGSRSTLSLASPMRLAALATNVVAVTLFVFPLPSVMLPALAVKVAVVPAFIWLNAIFPLEAITSAVVSAVIEEPLAIETPAAPVTLAVVSESSAPAAPKVTVPVFAESKSMAWAVPPSAVVNAAFTTILFDASTSIPFPPLASAAVIFALIVTSPVFPDVVDPALMVT